MRKIIFATHNAHKANEVRKMIDGFATLSTLIEEKIDLEVEEDGDTLTQNAFKKAIAIYEVVRMPVFADDTGLEVDALNGAPGVLSARYAGEPYSDKRNLQKLIVEMDGKQNRQARFRTVICFIEDGNPKYFEGIVTGKIVQNPKGLSGFGYDPVFLPDGYQQTFAEMDLSLKNTISHRGKAFRSFVEYMKNSFIE